MLDPEARILLDTMEKAVQEGRPRLNTLPHAVGRRAADNISEVGETDPPQAGDAIDGDFAGLGGKIRFRRYRPQGAAAGWLPMLIYYHGGGFVMAISRPAVRHLANSSAGECAVAHCGISLPLRVSTSLRRPVRSSPQLRSRRGKQEGTRHAGEQV